MRRRQHTTEEHRSARSTRLPRAGGVGGKCLPCFCRLTECACPGCGACPGGAHAVCLGECIGMCSGRGTATRPWPSTGRCSSSAAAPLGATWRARDPHSIHSCTLCTRLLGAVRTWSALGVDREAPPSAELDSKLRQRGEHGGDAAGNACDSRICRTHVASYAQAALQRQPIREDRLRRADRRCRDAGSGAGRPQACAALLPPAGAHEVEYMFDFATITQTNVPARDQPAR